MLPVTSGAVSDFFEPPPAQPAAAAEPRYRMPPWCGPPAGTLPGIVAVELVLARTAAAAVSITRIAAYPVGFELELVTMSPQDTGGLDPLLFGPPNHRPAAGGTDAAIPEQMLRFGVQFSDGSKATNTSGYQPRAPRTPPAEPIMQQRGGGGGGGSWSQSLWIWPLPPLGPLALVCEWPAAGIPLTRVEIAAQMVLDAAARSRVIFTDEHLPEFRELSDGGWTTYAPG